MQENFRSAREIMQARELHCHATLARSRFTLHIYAKKRVTSDNLLEFDNGDFVAAVGTCIYKKTMGKAALRLLFEDFANGQLSFENFLGHFAVWIYTGERLIVFNHYRGLYRICTNEDRTIISSSFLAVCESLTTRTPNPQGIFEYLAFDSTYGYDTVIREIDVLADKSIHQLSPSSTQTKKRICLSQYDGSRLFADQTRDVHKILSDHFSVLATLLGEKQSMGLTGGYDSRLILALFRQADVTPYVYVQGPDSSVDVRIAKLIARGENFPIQHDADEARPAFKIEQFGEKLRSAYFYLDGMPHTGIFDDWALVSEHRRTQQRPESIRIYGMGGEYFRATVAARDQACSEVASLATSICRGSDRRSSLIWRISIAKNTMPSTTATLAISVSQSPVLDLFLCNHFVKRIQHRKICRWPLWVASTVNPHCQRPRLDPPTRHAETSRPMQHITRRRSH
jgi:asparagine synthase (glutamine-hydrolysing)